MKCHEFKSLLGRAIAFRSASSEPWQEAFFSILDAKPDLPIKSLAKAIASTTPTNGANGSQISELNSFLQLLAALLHDQVKIGTFKELQDLTTALRKHSGSDLLALSNNLTASSKPIRKSKREPTPVRDEVVLRYFRRLEDALGDDAGFISVYGALEADEQLSAEEIAAIAKKFTSAAPKGRSAALKKILARHQAIMVSRAKSAATGGRIAG